MVIGVTDPRRPCLLVMLGVALALGGCAKMSTVTDAPVESGKARSFDAPYERVRTATLDSLVAMGIDPVNMEERPASLVVLISRPPHGISWGEVGRVIIEKSENPPTTVHVKYERRFALQFAGSGNRFAATLFTRIDSALRAAAAN
jgi:hypothetical protein